MAPTDGKSGGRQSLWVVYERSATLQSENGNEVLRLTQLELPGGGGNRATAATVPTSRDPEPREPREPAAARTVPAGGGGRASGSLLWSNVSEAGLGNCFGTVSQPLPGGEDVLLVTTDGANASLSRLSPATGELVWSKSIQGRDDDPPSSRFALSPLGGGGGGGSAENVIVWGASPSSCSAGFSSCVDIQALDPDGGKLLWEKDGVPVGNLPVFSVAAGVILVGGERAYAPNTANDAGGAQAIALSVASGALLFNVTVEQSTRSADWFVGATALVAGPSGAAELALVATVSGDNHAPAALFAVNVADGTPKWKATNVTAHYLYPTADVLVVTVDTRSIFGYNSQISMVRGYSLATGAELWQRTMKDRNADNNGAALRQACEVDCTLPCALVAAGGFGAIDAATGHTMYNLSGVPTHLAMANGIAYSIKGPTGAGRAKHGGRGFSSTPNGPGELVATACGGGADPGAPAQVLWSAPLPAGDDGGSVSAAAVHLELHRSLIGSAAAAACRRPGKRRWS